MDLTRSPCIIVIQVSGQLLRNESYHLLQKSLAERVDGLLSNDTAVAADIDQGLVGDLVPGLLHGISLLLEGGAVKSMVVSLEGTDGSHIKRRDQKGRLGGQEEDIKHPFARGKGLGLDIATDLGGGVRGESVHDKKGGLGDIIGDVIDVPLHARDVHSLDRLLASFAPSPTRSGGVLVGVCDEEGWDVYAISSDGQGQCVTEAITCLLDHWVVPKAECVHEKFEPNRRG